MSATSEVFITCECGDMFRRGREESLYRVHRRTHRPYAGVQWKRGPWDRVRWYVTSARYFRALGMVHPLTNPGTS